MRLGRGQIEVVDDQMADVLRRKSHAERLAIAGTVFRFARQMIVSRLRLAHADWSERQVVAVAARRLP